MTKYKDLTGKDIGRWHVIKRVTDTERKDSKSKQIRWLCQCSCKTHTQRILTTSELGRSKSCGCLRVEMFTNYTRNKGKTLNKYDLSGEYGIGYTNKGKEFYFDLEDYNLIKDYTWYNSHGYIVTEVWNPSERKSIRIMMHKIVLEKQLNKTLSNENDIDHISRKRLDNRKNNLRLCSHADNVKNGSLRSDNTSGVTGVIYNSSKHRWEARLQCNNKIIRLGRYKTKEEAIKARLQAEKEYFGEFAPQKNLFEKYNIN